MSIDLPDHQRRSIRLQDYDYSQPGAYFITVCSYQRNSIFGDLAEGQVRLNDAGQIVWEVWKSLPARYAHISLGAAIVMPDHFHGIVIIHDDVGAIHELPLPTNELLLPNNEFPAHHELQQPSERRKQRRRMTIPLVVGYFKMNTARRINELCGTTEMAIHSTIRPIHSTVGAIHELPLRKLPQPNHELPLPVWQRNYYERIIRGADDLQRITDYIETNPLRWAQDIYRTPVPSASIHQE